jgi:hypothetical protein
MKGPEKTKNPTEVSLLQAFENTSSSSKPEKVAKKFQRAISLLLATLGFRTEQDPKVRK